MPLKIKWRLGATPKAYELKIKSEQNWIFNQLKIPNFIRVRFSSGVGRAVLRHRNRGIKERNIRRNSARSGTLSFGQFDFRKNLRSKIPNATNESLLK